MISTNFTLNTTNSKHLTLDSVAATPKNADKDPVSSFAQALNQAFNKVNDLELNAQQMQINMVSNPESVNAHDVSIAQAKAELALSFAKSVSTRMVSAFNELITLR